MTIGNPSQRRNKSSRGRGRGRNKQHGSADSRRKGGNRDASPEKPADLQQDSQRYIKGSTQSQTSRSTGMLIEKQESQEETTSKTKFQKRKIESNWDKYEDFTVEDSEKSHAVTKSRGADLRALLSQPGGAASQLRLKDETWEEPSTFDEAESEIDELFKIDFKDVADRLQAIPLYERLGIPQKYFEKDVLDKINADAENHAERLQARINKDKSERSACLSGESKLGPEDRTRDNNQEQLTESVDSEKSQDLTQQRNIEVQDIARDSDNIMRTVDSVQCENKTDIGEGTSSPMPCSTETIKSPAEDQTMVTEHATSKVMSVSEDVHQDETSSDSPKTAETPVEPEAGGEGDLEDWLDDFLNDES